MEPVLVNSTVAGGGRGDDLVIWDAAKPPTPLPLPPLLEPDDLYKAPLEDRAMVPAPDAAGKGGDKDAFAGLLALMPL